MLAVTTRARDPTTGPPNPKKEVVGEQRYGIFAFLFAALPNWALLGDTGFVPGISAS
jgi:hypothetical protein